MKTKTFSDFLIRCFVLAVCVSLLVPGAAQSEPVKIRVGYAVPPAQVHPIVFQKTDIMKHYGKSYTVDLIHFRGTSPQLQAMAAKSLDVGSLSFSSFSTAITNARLKIKAIADLIRDGEPGYFSMPYGVLTSSGINEPSDLRNKVLTTNVYGGAGDLGIRVFMAKHGLKANKDYRIIEARFPAQEAMLRDKKIDLGSFPQPFWFKAHNAGGVKKLFALKDAMGITQMIFMVAREEFLEENRAVMVDFFEDYLTSLHWLMDPKNRDEMLKIASKFTKRPVKIYAGWYMTQNDYYRDPNAQLKVNALRNNVDTLHKMGFIKKKFNVADHVDTSFVDQALARIKK